MGAEVTGNNGKDTGTAERKAETVGSGRSSSTATERGTGTATGRGTGETTGTATGTAGEAEKEKPVRVAILSDEEQKREERNRKRRERYAKQKAENGGTVKPRKVNATKQQPKQTADTTTVSMVIGTISGIVASRPNMAHWQLTPTEIEQLAQPITNMLAESEAFQGLQEHSDAIALVTACFTIFVPRIVLTVATMPKKESKKDGGNIRTIHTDRQRAGQKNKDSDTDTKPSKEPANNGSNDDNTQPWLGGALA